MDSDNLTLLNAEPSPQHPNKLSLGTDLYTTVQSGLTLEDFLRLLLVQTTTNLSGCLLNLKKKSSLVLAPLKGQTWAGVAPQKKCCPLKHTDLISYPQHPDNSWMRQCALKAEAGGSQGQVKMRAAGSLRTLSKKLR